MKNLKFDLFYTTFATVDHNLHHTIRNAYTSYFSKHSVTRLEPTLQFSINKRRVRLEESRTRGDVMYMWHAYSALTADIISKCCFRESYNLSDLPSFAREPCSTMTGFSEITGWLHSIFASLLDTLLDLDLPARKQSTTRLIQKA